MRRVSVLASDMDGTLIPLEGEEANRRDLRLLCDEIRRQDLELVYVTGRHYQLALEAVTLHHLPNPDWMICDVGTSIYEAAPGRPHELDESYHAHLRGIIGSFGVGELTGDLSGLTGLRLQEPEKQGTFKLSYYCRANELDRLATEALQLMRRASAPYRVIASIDPFDGDGLIDFVPKGVSKDSALRWWVQHTRRQLDDIVFAGDSGNDLAALTAGYRSIVVGNADRSIADEASHAHQSAGWHDRLYLAEQSATSGVLEGLHYFLAKSDEA